MKTFPKNPRCVPFIESGSSHRPSNENYYESTRNYNTSRDSHKGIFTAEIKKNSKKDELALEIEEVTDYAASKARKSKQSIYGRDSRNDLYRHSEVGSQVGQAQLQALKAELYEDMAEMIKNQSSSYDKVLSQLIQQINDVLKRHEEGQSSIRRQSVHLQEELAKLATTFHLSAKENDEKMQTLLNEVASLSGSKKKGDYGVQLKNSFQGLNSSFSVNLANDSSNSKLVNEVIYQLDSLKKELAENKQQLDEITSKINITHTLPPNNQALSKGEMPKEELVALIDRRIKEERKSWKIEEKLEGLDGRVNGLQEVLQKHEENMFRINEEMTTTFNIQINPKLKKIEASIVDIYSKIDPLVLEAQLTDTAARQLEQRLKDTRLLRVRSCTPNESSRIGNITGMNEEKLTWRDTYLLDEENYLLDSEGRYLVEESGGQRRRVRVEEGQLYLLGLKGIQISSCS